MPIPLEVLDRELDRVYEGNVAADGTLTLRVTPREPAIWRVSQVSTEMDDAPIGSVCVIRKDGAKVTDMIETGDVAGGDPPVRLKPGQTMTIEWTGATVGDRGKAFVIYDRIPYGRR